MNTRADPIIYRFKSGWSAKRETGFLSSLKNSKIPGSRVGVFADNKWVLRDELGDPVDLDKYRGDLFDRHQECKELL